MTKELVGVDAESRKLQQHPPVNTAVVRHDVRTGSGSPDDPDR